MERYSLIKYVLILTLLTDGQSQSVDDVMYNLISRRIDGLLLALSKVSRQQRTIEKRLDEQKCDKCACCKDQDTTSNTSNKLKDEEPIGELMALKRAFVSEKKYQREVLEEMGKKVIELENQVQILEKDKAEKRLSEVMQGRVNTLERTLNSVQSTSKRLMGRAALVESKVTEIQDSSLEIGNRLDEIKSDVSSVMEKRKRKVSFTAQLRGRTTSIKKGRIVPFNKVHYNDGAGFNDTTGAFTVPETGVYLFIFFVEGMQNDEDYVCTAAIVQLFVDGNALVMTAVADPRESLQHIQAGNAYINHFSKGQQVDVRTSGSCKTSTIYGYRTTFSGILLY